MGAELARIVPAVLSSLPVIIQAFQSNKSNDKEQDNKIAEVSLYKFV